MISLIRIDDRLIHGQVATQWVASVSANTIMIVDDETANNEFTAMVCKGMAPLHVEVFVCTMEEAAEKLGAIDRDQNRRAIVLVKTPGVLLQLIDRGIPMKKIIVGGMGKRGDRKNFYKSIHVSDGEIEDFREIIKRKIELYVQMVPSDSAISVSGLIS